MLSYRHIFHAGNFADVAKHAALTLLIQALAQKDKPFCVLDTHAGAGRYDLMAHNARKNKEYQNGIAKLWQISTVIPELQPYLKAIKTLDGNSSTLRYYPGSPKIARALLRPADRLILTELHTTDAQLLREEFADDKQVAVHHSDGYQGLRAFLPPAERRGLVLLDPAFELQDEMKRMLAGLKEAYSRWPTGIYALWYPLHENFNHRHFYHALEVMGIPKILISELFIFPEDMPRNLNGSGMAIINPPYKIDAQLNRVLTWLWKILSVNGKGQVRVEWLVPE